MAAFVSPVHSLFSQEKESGFSEEVVSDFCYRLQPIGRILEVEGYYVWCNTPIMGDDGKVHVFYSRWPQGKGMGGWITCCEIAHATADTPAGPYETMDVAIAPRGEGYWDATTCHNPHVQKIGDEYCLFYMGNSNGKTNTKRVGLATADSLSGPWRRQEKPLLEPGPEGAWDDHCTTNPSYIRHPNGESWLYYKSWNTADYLNDQPPVRGNRKYGVAIAPDYAGPYAKSAENPLVDFSGLGENRQCEDAYVWLQDGVFKMIARDMGVFSHEVGLYMESRDGLHWSKPQIAFRELSYYVDQPPQPKHLKRYGRLERPQLLFQGGRPTHLFGASQGGKFNTSSGFVFSLSDE
ncbi:glycoside hydrolase family protein [Aeoliella sp. ICT_H6.2]|uniref:Glycoside hydrolase family protein n=1 Tax=Aeoliella straminimaris TaxID=2954799 RepID=A0A9X2F8J5_9BACT|nr:glycoside hydrolase family protein [Aeoliella straminimaris]MCO6044330.1 glycoside hydrolase family protein [Aeoliella straminimaris]